MAKDPGNEKSLFSRIKDCVLMELGRKPNKPEKAPCPSRSMWGYIMDKSDIDKEKRETYEPGKLGEQAADREEHEQDDARKKLDASRGKNSMEKRDSENKRRGNESLEKSHSENVQEYENETTDVEREKLAEQDCRANKFKPARYYIKMQDPEAPACCKSHESHKNICPPKTRKLPPQQICDGHRLRSECQCDACSSRADSLQ